ncbi:MAG: cystathionine beta-lyase [Rhodospirillales bacterium]|nr:MAG: cystathionine beta-lyase [Rhodospirillales bacterium]
MKDDTLLTHAGNAPFENYGVVNPPVYHASTILSPTLEAYLARGSAKVRYGRSGTPTSFALEDAVAELEGGTGAVLTPSGLAAITTVLLACTRAGDHVLMTDSAYQPTRRFCDTILAKFGVQTEYYDPLIGGDIAALIRPETTVVYVESPGSLTFEVQDLPAIAAAAHDAGATVVADNTWGAGYYYKPLALGADIVLQAGTKYIVGHADTNMGVIVWKDHERYGTVRTDIQGLGVCAGPDDIYLALRGLRTMGVRLQRQQQSGLVLARWLADRPEVARVMHPALEGDPGHELWKRDFTGACSLFGFVLASDDMTALAAMMDGLQLHGMGASWGGYESLLIPTWPNKSRTATKWKETGQTMRIHVGLEDPDDLIADLEAGFERYRKAG